MESKRLKVVFTSLERGDRSFFSKALRDFNLALFEEGLSDVDISRIADADILSVFVFDKVDRKTLEKFKNLRLIHTRSVGYDHIDLDYCKEKGIKVTHVPAYSPSAVAQHALALILALLRHVERFKARTRNFEFSRDETLLANNLEDITVGVVGTGRIGGSVAKYLKVLGANVLAYDLYPKKELADLGVEYVSLEDILRKSDVITLHVPYTPQTHHLISEETISLMKKGVILVNTSRGGVIDTKAVYEAFLKGKISGLGLDVFEEEEVLIRKEYGKASSISLMLLELNTKDNVIITPHVAFYTRRAVENIRRDTLKVIKAFVEGDEDVLKAFSVKHTT